MNKSRNRLEKELIQKQMLGVRGRLKGKENRTETKKKVKQTMKGRKKWVGLG